MVRGPTLVSRAAKAIACAAGGYVFLVGNLLALAQVIELAPPPLRAISDTPPLAFSTRAVDTAALQIAPAQVPVHDQRSKPELEFFVDNPMPEFNQGGSQSELVVEQQGQPSRPTGLDVAESLFIDPAELRSHRPASALARLWQDELNIYSPESLALIGAGLGVGAVLANTSLDRDFQSHIQSSLHHANTDEWLEGLHANKEFGDGRYTLPVFAGVWALGSFLPESSFSDATRIWGERSLRGFVIGAPPVLLLQLATGGSRPGETNHGSEWEPIQDNNGVSGHSFMGALPFITAAKMTDSVGLKATFYAASALAPLSRTADGAHYPSQIALGWWMAYVAVSAVHATDHPEARWRLFPTADANGSGMAFEYRF